MADLYLVEQAKGPAWDPSRGRLAGDPWMERMLTIESIRPWSIWVRAGR